MFLNQKAKFIYNVNTFSRISRFCIFLNIVLKILSRGQEKMIVFIQQKISVNEDFNPVFIEILNVLLLKAYASAHMHILFKFYNATVRICILKI